MTTGYNLDECSKCGQFRLLKNGTCADCDIDPVGINPLFAEQPEQQIRIEDSVQVAATVSPSDRVFY